MNEKLSIKKIGIAAGIAATIFYVGCALVMMIGGKAGTIKLYNSLLHGMDTTSIIKMNVPISESLIGVVLTFILAGLFGAILAYFYNLQLRK
jgi:hypothetical protein